MKHIFGIIGICILVGVPILVHAEGITYKALVGIPGISNPNSASTQQYVDALFTVAIGLAAVLAVIRLIWAGVEYMFSELVPAKESAKQKIQGALLGLIIILASVTILQTINPNLLNLNMLENAEPLEGAAKSNTTNTSDCSGEVIYKEGKRLCR